MIICTSGLDSQQKKELSEATRSLGGSFSGQLTLKTTHLVASTPLDQAAGEFLFGLHHILTAPQLKFTGNHANLDSSVYALSKKYATAVEKGLKIVLPQWITDSVEKREWLPVDGYTVPPFVGATLCCTGIDEDVRQRLLESFEQNGGRFEAHLLKGTTTHLVASSPQGVKYAHALQWGVPVVSQQWVEHSAAAQACLALERYSLLPTAQSATAENTGLRDSSKSTREKQQPKDYRRGAEDDTADEIPVSARDAGCFFARDVSQVPDSACLDGCVIYLAGFSNNANDDGNDDGNGNDGDGASTSQRRLLSDLQEATLLVRKGMGTRCFDLSPGHRPAVTHVVIASTTTSPLSSSASSSSSSSSSSTPGLDPSERELIMCARSKLGACLVTPTWLLASCRHPNQQLAPEASFRWDHRQKRPPNLRRPGRRRRGGEASPPPASPSLPPKTPMMSADEDEDEDEELTADLAVERRAKQEDENQRCDPSNALSEVGKREKVDTTTPSYSSSSSAVALSNVIRSSSTSSSSVFRGKSFLLHCPSPSPSSSSSSSSPSSALSSSSPSSTGDQISATARAAAALSGGRGTSRGDDSDNDNADAEVSEGRGGEADVRLVARAITRRGGVAVVVQQWDEEGGGGCEEAVKRARQHLSAHCHKSTRSDHGGVGDGGGGERDHAGGEGLCSWFVVSSSGPFGKDFLSGLNKLKETEAAAAASGAGGAGVVTGVTWLWLRCCFLEGALCDPRSSGLPSLFLTQPWTLARFPHECHPTTNPQQQRPTQVSQVSPRLSSSPSPSLSLSLSLSPSLSSSSGFVVSVSGFMGAERSGLADALECMGARYTKEFSRRNTHLVCHSPEGSKYEAACTRQNEWGVVVVGKEWVLHCAQFGWTPGCEQRFALARLSRTDGDDRDEKDDGTHADGRGVVDTDENDDENGTRPAIAAVESKGGGRIKSSLGEVTNEPKFEVLKLEQIQEQQHEEHRISPLSRGRDNVAAAAMPMPMPRPRSARKVSKVVEDHQEAGSSLGSKQQHTQLLEKGLDDKDDSRQEEEEGGEEQAEGEEEDYSMMTLKRPLPKRSAVLGVRRGKVVRVTRSRVGGVGDKAMEDDLPTRREDMPDASDDDHFFCESQVVTYS